MLEKPSFIPVPQETQDSLTKKQKILMELESNKTRRDIMAMARSIKSNFSEADIEDITQKTLLRAFTAIQKDSFDFNTDLGAWLFTITKRLIFDETKKRRRHREKGLVNEIPEGIDVADYQPNPEEQLVSAQVVAKHHKMIDELPKELRDTMNLRAQGLTASQIASIQKIPRGTAMSRMHRAKLNLQTKLKGDIKK